MAKKIQKKISKKIFKYILDIVVQKYPLIRKRKYSYEYYLNQFIYVLTSVSSWSKLSLLYTDKTKEYHYKTIYNEFIKWSNDNIFEEAYYKFISENYYKFSHINKNTWSR
jgi:hypothetical protein